MSEELCIRLENTMTVKIVKIPLLNNDQDKQCNDRPKIKIVYPLYDYTNARCQDIVNNAHLMEHLCNLVVKGHGHQAIQELFKAKHTDPKRPQTHNVRYSNLTIEFLKKGEWETCHADVGATMLVCHLASDIMEYVDDHEKEMQSSHVSKLRKWYQTLFTLYEKEYTDMMLKYVKMITCR